MYNDLVEKFQNLQKENKDASNQNDDLGDKKEELERDGRDKDTEIKRLEREIQYLKDNAYSI